MKRNTPIQLKAAFLMIVFSLNTIIGFACSVSIDMGFNSKHHHEEEEATEAVVHVHKNGKQHVHHETKHSHNKSHHHDLASHQHKSGSDKDDCCNDKVRNFQQLDKSVPNTVNVIHPVFLTAFLASYYNINILPHSDIVKDIKPFVRSYHPPIPDIRLAIQSYQI